MSDQEILTVEQTIHQIQKTEALEMFYGEVLDFLLSILDGKNDMVEEEELMLIDEEVKELRTTFVDKRDACIGKVLELKGMKVQNVQTDPTG